MGIRRVVGLFVVGVCFSMAIPEFVPAQIGGSSEEPQVRIRLLQSGGIQVDGDFVLETPDREVTFRGKNVVVSNEGRLADLTDGMIIETLGFVVEADSGSVVLGDNGEVDSLHLRTARIDRTQ